MTQPSLFPPLPPPPALRCPGCGKDLSGRLGCTCAHAPAEPLPLFRGL